MNRAIDTIKEYLEDFVNLFYPRICINCHTILVYQEEHICTKCRLSLPKTNYHKETENRLFQKFAFEPKVSKVTAFIHFNKRGIAQKLIHELKYKNQPSIGVLLGKWMGVVLKEEAMWCPDLIIPVPIHGTKLRKRGYNQSECFAEGLSEAMGIPFANNWIIRNRKTATQTSKTKIERWENVSSVYSITELADLKGKCVLVVDDVLTTGATLGELVTLIALQGVSEIQIATIAAGK